MFFGGRMHGVLGTSNFPPSILQVRATLFHLAQTFSERGILRCLKAWDTEICAREDRDNAENSSRLNPECHRQVRMQTSGSLRFRERKASWRWAWLTSSCVPNYVRPMR